MYKQTRGHHKRRATGIGTRTDVVQLIYEWNLPRDKLKYTRLYNYADDIILSFTHEDQDYNKQVLENESSRTLNWFYNKGMKANPSKCKVVCVTYSANQIAHG